MGGRVGQECFPIALAMPDDRVRDPGFGDGDSGWGFGISDPGSGMSDQGLAGPELDDPEVSQAALDKRVLLHDGLDLPPTPGDGDDDAAVSRNLSPRPGSCQSRSISSEKRRARPCARRCGRGRLCR